VPPPSLLLPLFYPAGRNYSSTQNQRVSITFLHRHPLLNYAVHWTLPRSFYSVFRLLFFRSLIDFFRSTSSVFGIFSSFIKLLFSGFSSLLFLSGFFFFTDPHRTLFPDLRNIPPIQMCATPVSLFLLESRSYVFGGLYLLFSDYRVNRQVFVGLYLSFLNSPHNLYKI